MARLSKSGAKKLLALTVLAIISYALGALSHSEIIHYFSEIFGIK